MIQINNKFDVGQKVYCIGRRCMTNNKKKKFKWIVKNKEPVKILCIYYKYKLFGESELRYYIENYGKVKEKYLFVDYDSAKMECDRHNEEEKKL